MSSLFISSLKIVFVGVSFTTLLVLTSVMVMRGWSTAAMHCFCLSLNVKEMNDSRLLSSPAGGRANQIIYCHTTTSSSVPPNVFCWLATAVSHDVGSPGADPATVSKGQNFQLQKVDESAIAPRSLHWQEVSFALSFFGGPPL